MWSSLTFRTEEEFRNDVKRATSSENEFVVVYYDRELLGTPGVGHFSPVAGYNSRSDFSKALVTPKLKQTVVLLLDIVRDRHPPLWVPTGKLFGSLFPLDPETNKPRGYFLVTKSEVAPMVCLTTGKDK